jgi:hypothetical protein
MGIFDSLLARPDADAHQRASAEGSPLPSPSSPLPSDDGRASLERRRDELVAQVAELHWDLGGLAYEMAIRDHFRLDVLVRRAAELQERDAELGELERVLSLQESAGAGSCPGCGAVHARGALYCWQCGKVLMERVPSAAANGATSAPAGSGERTEAQTVTLPPGFAVGQSGGGEGHLGAPVSSGLANDGPAPTVALPPHPPTG